jgi:cytochrome P450
MLRFDANDLADPVRYAQRGRPWELWARLRREAPVAWCEPDGFEPFWAITRHADIVAISRDPGRFSSAIRLVMLQRDDVDVVQTVRSIVNMDPPDHGPHRAIGNRWFIPRNLRNLEDRVRSLARDLLDAIAERGATQIDFVREIAVPLPMRLICGLLGLPVEDEPFALRIANEAFAGDDPELQRSGGARRGETVAEAFAYFTRLLADRRQSPRQDLLSVIATAEVDGKPIQDFEALSWAFLVMTAGIDTTRNSMGSGIVELLARPDQFERVRRDSSLIPTAVEEILRWTTPVNHFMRTATCDTEVRGVPILEGQSVALFYPSANRDEDVFSDPDRFLVDRKPNHHLAFGIGEHFCLGAGLARMQIRVLLEELLPRLRHIAPAGEPRPIQTNFIVGFKEVSLEIELAPRGTN